MKKPVMAGVSRGEDEDLRRERERERERDLFKRETEHLCLRPPIHGIGRDPLTRE